MYKCYSNNLSLFNTLIESSFLLPRMYLITPSPWCNSRLLDVSCKPLSSRPIIRQSILTSDIDKLDYRVCLHCSALGGLIGVKHMEHQRNGGW